MLVSTYSAELGTQFEQYIKQMQYDAEQIKQDVFDENSLIIEYLINNNKQINHTELTQNIQNIYLINKTQTNTKIRCRVKVAAIQSPSIFGNVSENIKLFTKQIEIAASNGAKIIVLPEAAITGYSSQDLKHSWCTKEKSNELLPKFKGHDPCNIAQFKDGPIIKHFISLCQKLKIYCTVPYVEKAQNKNYINNYDDDDDKKDEPIMVDEDVEYLYYNSITLINPNGDIIGHYRKINLWPSYDNSWATKGDEIVTAQTEYGTVGLAVCYDIHKILPLYKEKNIWSLLYCIAWVSKQGKFVEDENTFRWFNMQLPARLNSFKIPYYIIGSNWSVNRYRKPNTFLNDNNNNKLEWAGFGFSTIYGPKGIILKQSSYKKRFGNDIIYAQIPYVQQ